MHALTITRVCTCRESRGARLGVGDDGPGGGSRGALGVGVYRGGSDCHDCASAGDSTLRIHRIHDRAQQGTTNKCFKWTHRPLSPKCHGMTSLATSIMRKVRTDDSVL